MLTLALVQPMFDPFPSSPRTALDLFMFHDGPHGSLLSYGKFREGIEASVSLLSVIVRARVYVYAAKTAVLDRGLESWCRVQLRNFTVLPTCCRLTVG